MELLQISPHRMAQFTIESRSPSLESGNTEACSDKDSYRSPSLFSISSKQPRHSAREHQRRFRRPQQSRATRRPRRHHSDQRLPLEEPVHIRCGRRLYPPPFEALLQRHPLLQGAPVPARRPQGVPPLGLGPYADRLKAFFQGREYPGSWDGLDPHGYDRNVVLMEWDDVPEAVRVWIDEQAKQKKETKKGKKTDEEEKKREDLSGKGLFAVYRKARAPKDHKVIIFAPGAIYETLPLWVAEDSECESTLRDMSKYAPEATDGAVVGWVTEHTSPNRAKQEREMQFTIRVESLKLAEAAAPESSSSVRDEL
ncbi:hypothetical protein PG993_012000 [Apiospora rasikravindrae]|uniref:Uncharacterized protein n=1 Tax=Apiospora rasikravindrae TaxID=990691 RepID=A0ABR1S196_9PEZI